MGTFQTLNIAYYKSISGQFCIKLSFLFLARRYVALRLSEFKKHLEKLRLLNQDQSSSVWPKKLQSSHSPFIAKL